MPSLSIYLIFQGNTEQAFNFYKSVFGGEFLQVQRFGDMPDSDQIPADEKNKIMHIGLAVGNTYIMGTDALESMGQKVTFGNNSYITITPETKDEADRFYQALSEGGKIEMELQDTFWGAYYASFSDKFGLQWMINYDYPKE
ncbi:MAG: VOC family protein [Ignavibacteriales bacterium]